MGGLSIVDDLRQRVRKLEDENFELKERLKDIGAQIDPWFTALRGRSFTPMEAKITGFLALHNTASRKALYSYLYDFNDPAEIKIVDVCVCRIRKKLPAGIEVQTIYGVGFFMSKEHACALADHLGLRMGIGDGQVA